MAWRVLSEIHSSFTSSFSSVARLVETVVDAARSGTEAGDGIVWTSEVENVTHNRTGLTLEEVEAA